MGPSAKVSARASMAISISMTVIEYGLVVAIPLINAPPDRSTPNSSMTEHKERRNLREGTFFQEER